jgi:H+/gluconate symporter-like permease
MVLGVPLGILGIYFLVKFIDRTNKIDEEQKRQIAINEAKIEAIKNDNDKKIKQNSKPSSWFSAFYYLILIGAIGAAFQDRNNSENVKIDNNSGNTPTKKILSDTELKQYCTLEKICKEYQK